MLVLIAYDIPDDRRRNKLRTCLKNFGFRVQYSIFIGRLERPDVLRMKAAVKRITKRKDDSVHFYYLCEQCQERMEDLNGKRKASLPSALFA